MKAKTYGADNMIKASTTRFLISYFFVLLFPIVASAQPSQAFSGPSADSVAHDFYTQYLQCLKENQDPLCKALVNKYVSTSLVQKIDKMMHSPDGMEEDYFTKSQDFMEDWLSNVAVDAPTIKGQIASVTVTLGKAEKYQLSVTLIWEGDAWKIRKVTKL